MQLLTRLESYARVADFVGEPSESAMTMSDIIGLISVSVWALFVLLYIYKMIYFSQEVRDEYCCPIRFSFLALIAITTMLSGDILYRWFPLIGEGLIWIGTSIGNRKNRACRGIGIRQSHRQ